MSEHNTRMRSEGARRKRFGEEYEEVPLKRQYKKNDSPTIKLKFPPSSLKKDTPHFVKSVDDKKSAPKEFSSSEDSEIDVTGDCVLPKITSAGEVLKSANEKTPTKNEDDAAAMENEEEETEDVGDVETVFSSFPCHVIPDTLTRLTKTPVDGEHLEVRKMANGRLRIMVSGMKAYTPYSTMTHRPCIVCTRQMLTGEMHLNFPADLDRRRIWANLLGFKYKDILRSKIGPVTLSVAGGPICTEHFAEECFRNHNFNKAAIEAFGVPVAISPDVKTTPSKKRVPWVCTICTYNTCSVTGLRDHLLAHTDEMLKDQQNSLHAPQAGFMCPFCRKCTYGYRTVSGFRRHLLAPPAAHCHLRRIYEFAKMNCRSSELEPIESWEKWTRRNVYVAYHGCEPPVDEIVLTPSPTKAVKDRRFELRRGVGGGGSAVRSLSFGGAAAGGGKDELESRKTSLRKSKIPEEDVKPIVDDNNVVSSEELQASSSSSTESKPNSRVSSPTKNQKKKEVQHAEKRKKVDDAAFQQMIEKRSNKLKRLINAKMQNQQQQKPRKPTFTLKTSGSSASESTSDSKISREGSPSAPLEPKVEDIVKNEEEEEEEEVEDERPLKSVLARSFAAGMSTSMDKYRMTASTDQETHGEGVGKAKMFTPGYGSYGGGAGGGQAAATAMMQEVRRYAGPIRPGALARRPIILQSTRAKPARQVETLLDRKSASNSPAPERIATPSQNDGDKERATPSPVMMTLADVLAKQSETQPNDDDDASLDMIAEELMKEPSYSQTAVGEIKQKIGYKMKQEMRMSKQCIRQLEAARARARLFGEGNEDEQRYDIVNTDEGPQLIAKNDPEWKLRYQNMELKQEEVEAEEVVEVVEEVEVESEKP